MNKQLQPVEYRQLNDWPDDDHLAAMASFLKSAQYMLDNPYKTRGLGVSSDLLAGLSKKAVTSTPFTRESAKAFFEEYFQPCEFTEPGQKTGDHSGFVTAYFEPEVSASRIKTPNFQCPLYARPDDLVDVTDENRPAGLNPDYRFARYNDNKTVIEEYPDRKAIGEGYLEGKSLEIAWVRDEVEALFIQIQGSARLRFSDGTFARIGYAAKSGHPYTAIGKVLLDGGALSHKNSGMQAIRNWFAANPDQTKSVIDQNRSFIFFAEHPAGQPAEGPLGAAKVSLTPGRSLAVDRTLHTFGSPVWIETASPLPDSGKLFQRLMVAQDTGSAIVGVQRGDLFLGSGQKAGNIAGEVRHRARFVVFVPVDPV